MHNHLIVSKYYGTAAAEQSSTAKIGSTNLAANLGSKT
jgi:hypothetical protein